MQIQACAAGRPGQDLAEGRRRQKLERRCPACIAWAPSSAHAPGRCAVQSGLVLQTRMAVSRLRGAAGTENWGSHASVQHALLRRCACGCMVLCGRHVAMQQRFSGAPCLRGPAQCAGLSSAAAQSQPLAGRPGSWEPTLRPCISDLSHSRRRGPAAALRTGMPSSASYS